MILPRLANLPRQALIAAFPIAAAVQSSLVDRGLAHCRVGTRHQRTGQEISIQTAWFVYCGGSRALMSFSSAFSCRTSSSKRSSREGADADAIEGSVTNSSVGVGMATAPLKRCA